MLRTPMKWNDLSEEACPVARAMSVIGDRWTLLILRDCLFGFRRFDDIQRRLGITRHVLAERLKKLETAGLLDRRPYQERPVRHEYVPTQAAKDFIPVMQVMIGWANDHLSVNKPSPYKTLMRDTREPIAPKVIDANTGTEITSKNIWIEEND
ncbi:MAG: winged helix-turn-helix transcriptional regulator [Shimia sp.]|uniref:winged helix-turn-helix transcriptional regulator n=1 Tax=Shimia sp. TaxID=1954381 RepID=UPI004058EB95